MSTPIRATRSDCCARAASGQSTAVLPSGVELSVIDPRDPGEMERALSEFA
jgi:hypothetical protein